MYLVNLTPHAITLRGADGIDTTIAPDPRGPARVTTTRGTPADLDGIPVPVFSPDGFGRVENMPGIEYGGFFIVSAVVGAALAAEPDGSKYRHVLVPGTGPGDNPVRDDAGRIVAVRCLKRIVP